MTKSCAFVTHEGAAPSARDNAGSETENERREEGKEVDDRSRYGRKNVRFVVASAQEIRGRVSSRGSASRGLSEIHDDARRPGRRDASDFQRPDRPTVIPRLALPAIPAYFFLATDEYLRNCTSQLSKVCDMRTFFGHFDSLRERLGKGL